MTIEAVALLKVPYAGICQTLDLPPATSAKEALDEMSTFFPIGADGTGCRLDLPFASDAQELLSAAWTLTDGAVQAHEDARGLLVVPDRGLSSADLSSYAAAVAHFGEAGQWLELPDEVEVMPTGAGGFPEMMGGGFAQMMEQMQAAMTADPSLMQTAASLAQQLPAASGGPGGMPDSGNLLAMAEGMLSRMSPEQRAQLEQMASSMFGQGVALPGMPPTSPAPSRVAPAKRAAQPSVEEDDDPEFGSGDK